MPLFRAQVFKRLLGNDREWSNTYLIQATSLDDAVTAATPIPSNEQSIHADNVTITRMRVSDLIKGTDVFTVIPLALIGNAYTAADFEQIPLFNTVRVDISVAGGGRPSRKYYRGPVGEQWQTNGLLDTSVRTLFADTVLQMIADVTAQGGTIADNDNQAWLTPSTWPLVQMRQLHRKRKKKKAPSP